MSDICDVVWTNLPPIPKGVKPLAHQVAGHIFGRLNGHKKNQLGFLQNEDGQILKPIQGPRKGKREAEFYEKLFNNNLMLPELVELKDFVPKYFGLWTTEEHPGISYMKLENVTNKFNIPCVMDIKIGPITYDRYADPSKIQREKLKSPCLEKIGFQILGIKVFSKDINEYKMIDRDFLRALDEISVLNKGLKTFFNLQEPFSHYLLTAFLNRLIKIQNWFLHQKKYYFIASSLLFVYDAKLFDAINQMKSGCPNQSCSMTQSSDSIMQIILNSFDLKMIDFTHVFEFESGDSLDDNYIIGINNLINYMKLLQIP